MRKSALLPMALAAAATVALVGPGRWPGAGLAQEQESKSQEQEAQAQGAAEAPRLDFDAHLLALADRVPEGFHVVVQRPFVVIGDERPNTVQRRALRTVKWAVDHLKKAYFEKDPKHIIDIWLFKDRDSYRKHTEELFGDKPDTPFGYYSPHHRALIMNIATGGGTLVHEIVHPFVAANFPDCPAWFNEGLGSLYEQCAEKDGAIAGLTNWRLAGLKEALRQDRVPSTEELLSTSDVAFYGSGSGLHYAQARYLCYYLQEKGQLRTYYREFRAHRKEDPTGYQTLLKVLGVDDVESFEREWRGFVLGLRFP